MNGSNTRIALAAGLGYLLGRRRRLRWALTLGAAAAAGWMSKDPQAFVRRTSQLLPSGGELGQIADLRKPLAAAGKAAAVAAVSHGIDSVGGRIRRQADALRGTARGEQAAETADRGGQRRPEAGRPRPGDPEDEYSEQADSERERAPQRPPGKRATGAVKAGRPRQRSGEDEGDEARPQPVRRAGGQRSEAAGAPVRRQAGER